MSKRLTHEEFLRFSDKFDPNVIILGEYKTAKDKLLCECKKCRNRWYVTPDSLKRGSGCPECKGDKIANSILLTHDEFASRLKERYPHIRIIGKYTGMNKHIECVCTLHDIGFSSKAYHILDGHNGCKKCAYEKTYEKRATTNKEFVSRLQKINANIIPLGEYKYNKERISVRCYKCSFSWNPTAGSLLSGLGCPFCNRPSSEKKMDVIFRKHNIFFEPQKTFDDLKGKRNIRLSYDFFLPEYDLLIEMQGKFHDNSIPMKEVMEWFPDRKRLDKEKRQYALLNGYNFLEIWYYEMDKAEKILIQKINGLKNPATTTVA